MLEQIYLGLPLPGFGSLVNHKVFTMIAAPPTGRIGLGGAGLDKGESWPAEERDKSELCSNAKEKKNQKKKTN